MFTGKYTYKAYDGGINIVKKGRIIRTVPCNADREVLETLATDCNELELDPIHIDDVIEDLLYDISISGK